MNREELLKLVDSLNFKKTEFYVLSGGSLLIRKLRERTEDLDLCVSNELFKNIVDKYKIKEESKNAGGFYHILKEVEVIPISKEDFKMEYIDGYPVQTLENILEYKKKLNRPKDKKDIEIIMKYLNEHKKF